MKLLVKNLHHDIDNKQLTELFSQYGQVEWAEVMYDKFNGYSKGFAYVKMKTIDDGVKAIRDLHGKEVKGQALEVMEKPKE